MGGLGVVTSSRWNPLISRIASRKGILLLEGWKVARRRERESVKCEERGDSPPGALLLGYTVARLVGARG